MSDNELYAKLGVAIVCLIAAMMIGWVLVVFVGPIFVGLAIIDTIMRQSYGPKLRAVQAAGGLIEEPSIDEFVARVHDGQVVIGWSVDLPGSAYMDIYRVQGAPGASVGELQARGVCIHSTRTPQTRTIEEALIDYDAPDGVIHYVPVLLGRRIEKVPLDYGFFDFYKEVKFRTKRQNVELRGPACRVEYARNPPPIAVPDGRDEATKMAEEIVTSLVTRKAFDAQLDAAIARINANSELTEDEKLEAIELLETRAAAQ